MATLSDDLHRLVQGTNGRACTTLMRLHRLFLDKGIACYLYLNKAFHNFLRDDLSIADYAHKLLVLADDLAAIGRPVSDNDLTGAFMDGLSKRFKKLQGELLKNSETLPSFAVACARLQHSELDDDTEQLQSASQVMVTHGGDCGQSSVGTRQQRPWPWARSNWRRARVRGQLHGARRWTATMVWLLCACHHAIPTSCLDSLQRTWRARLASSPTNSAYPIMNSTAPPPMEPMAPSAPEQPTSWDSATMYQNAPRYKSAFHASGGDWVMDSGASSHVTGNPGTLILSHYSFEPNSQHIIFGNGSRLPIVATGTTALTSRPFYHNNALVSPHIVKNLISTRKFFARQFYFC
jgi:hypothetical protein